MKNFVDRQPVYPGRRKLKFESGNSETVTVEMFDEATNEGTPLNRRNLMALQGFQSGAIEFRADGAVVETNDEGDTLVTTFPSDSICLETFTPADGSPGITKRTYSDGNTIREEVFDGTYSIS